MKAQTQSICYRVRSTLITADEAQWLTWMKDTHIPEVLQQAGFQAAHVQKVIEPPTAHSTYTVDYTVASREALETYQAGPGVGLKADYLKHFPCETTRVEREILKAV